jgi:hypothetical protein
MSSTTLDLLISLDLGQAEGRGGRRVSGCGAVARERHWQHAAWCDALHAAAQRYCTTCTQHRRASAASTCTTCPGSAHAPATRAAACSRPPCPPEGLRRRQVHAVVVAQVVVADDGGGLEAGAHQEVHQHALHLGLPALEVVTANEHVVLHSHVDAAGHKGILWGAVDEGHALLDAGHGVEGGGGDLGLVALDGGQQVGLCVVQALHDLCGRGSRAGAEGRG